MSVRIRKDILDALSAARKGDTVDLSGFVIPYKSAGSLIQTKEPRTDRIRSFMWSDHSVDRDNDTIDPLGWKLDRFYKNGAILWAHNPTLPTIGTPRNFRVERTADTGQLKGDIEFSSVNPFAEMLLGLVDEGALKNVSVGFLPVKWTINQERGGIDFLEQELMEGSLVPVGSNANAMLEASNQKGIDLQPMQEWAEKWLDEDETVVSCVADPDEVLVIHKALKGWTKSDAGVVLPDPVAESVTEGSEVAAVEPTEPEIVTVAEAELPTADELDGTSIIENMVSAIEGGTLDVEDVEKALSTFKIPEKPEPEPDYEITEEDLRKMVRDMLVDPKETSDPDAVDESFVRRTLTDELRKVRSDFLRESGRLPN